MEHVCKRRRWTPPDIHQNHEDFLVWSSWEIQQRSRAALVRSTRIAHDLRRTVQIHHLIMRRRMFFYVGKATQSSTVLITPCTGSSCERGIHPADARWDTKPHVAIQARKCIMDDLNKPHFQVDQSCQPFWSARCKDGAPWCGSHAMRNGGFVVLECTKLFFSWDLPILWFNPADIGWHSKPCESSWTQVGDACARAWWQDAAEQQAQHSRMSEGCRVLLEGEKSEPLYIWVIWSSCELWLVEIWVKPPRCMDRTVAIGATSGTSSLDLTACWPTFCLSNFRVSNLPWTAYWTVPIRSLQCVHGYLCGAVDWAYVGSSELGSTELESVASAATGSIGEDTSGRAVSTSMSRRTPDQGEEFEILKAELMLCKAEIGSLKAKIEVLESEKGLDFEVISSAPYTSAAPASAPSAHSLPDCCWDLASGLAKLSKVNGGACRDARRLPCSPGSIWSFVMAAAKTTIPLCSLTRGERPRLGDSLFVGLPSKADGRIMVRHAGVSLPAELQRWLKTVHLKLARRFQGPSATVLRVRAKRPSTFPTLWVFFNEPLAQACSVIAVVDVDGKVLVAVPDSAWHK